MGWGWGLEERPKHVLTVRLTEFLLSWNNIVQSPYSLLLCPRFGPLLVQEHLLVLFYPQFYTLTIPRSFNGREKLAWPLTIKRKYSPKFLLFTLRRTILLYIKVLMKLLSGWKNISFFTCRITGFLGSIVWTNYICLKQIRLTNN